MRINVTLLIQITNFTVTYLVLNRFFFKPIIDSLNKKELVKKELELKIDSEESILLGLAKKKTADVLEFQSMIKKKYPYEPYSVKITADSQPSITEKKVDPAALEKEIVDFLSKEVPNVY